MIRSLSGQPKAVIFYVLTLTMALGVALLPVSNDGQHQILNMLTPTIGVLVLLLVLTPDGYYRAGWLQLALHRPGWRSWPLALVVPTVILCASYGAAWLCGVLTWSFEADVLLNLVITIVINSVFAIFKEIGWQIGRASCRERV